MRVASGSPGRPSPAIRADIASFLSLEPALQAPCPRRLLLRCYYLDKLLALCRREARRELRYKMGLILK